jgi:hypothetical protein
MIAKKQEVVKFDSFGLLISGVQRKGIVVGRVKIVCFPLHQMNTEQDMPARET